jgi:phthalate 4,5-dioxygenase oxygenase subunit
MLTPEENELLTRVGPGTPMGLLMRAYWLPALLSTELPEADGKPLRLRLLGEHLLAFRDSDGSVGVIGEHCAHRGASLYYGRNEKCGMRCVYHGWKYDRSGQCVDMPSEPPESTFKDKIKLAGYPPPERSGMVWVYMGPLAEPPALPALEWAMLPRDQSHISKRVQQANWAQVLEGGIDSSHGGFLHSMLDNANMSGKQRRGYMFHQVDTHPRYEIVDTAYGSVIGARRSVEGKYYWRIYQFLMPFYTMIPPYADLALGGHAFVPRDDETTIVWTATWHPARPLQEGVDERHSAPGTHGIHVTDFLPPSPEADGAWFPRASRANDYFLDWAKQKTERMSGIPGVPIQDAAMQESMGAIYDRSNEHLGASDAAIIHVRRRWLRLAKALASGEQPALPGIDCAPAYNVRSAGVMLDTDQPWFEAAQKWLQAEAGVLQESV